MVTSEWSPQSETYNIADTIFLFSNFSKLLTDQINSSLIIDYTNAVSIGGNITIYKIDTTSHELTDAATNFGFHNAVGTVNTSQLKPLRIKDVYYDELSSSYALRLSVAPQQKGIFVFYISNLYSNGLRGKDCTNAGFANTVTNTERGLSLFEYAMGRPPASQYEIDRMYCFRVQ